MGEKKVSDDANTDILTWRQVGGKIAAIEQTDKYGGDISISDDGSILLFSYATDTKGAVRIYRLRERGS